MQPSFQEIINDVNAAFQKSNSEQFLQHCTDNITWIMPGGKSVSGKEPIRELFCNTGEMDMELPTPKIEKEGDLWVCTGSMTMKDKDGKSWEGHYRDEYTFAGNKIAKMESTFANEDGTTTQSNIPCP